VFGEKSFYLLLTFDFVERLRERLRVGASAGMGERSSGMGTPANTFDFVEGTSARQNEE